MPKRNNRVAGQDADVELPTRHESFQACEGPTFTAPVSITIYHYRCRLADPDGISAKAAIDGLVHCGILRDDSAKEISEIRHIQVKVKNAEDERTEITITEIDSTISDSPSSATPMGRIMGRWPGDETDKEIEQALAILDPDRPRK